MRTLYVSGEGCIVGVRAVMGASVRIALAAQTHDTEETKQKCIRGGADILTNKQRNMALQTERRRRVD